MNDLGTHISDLLNESPSVYLPGIGTFKKERVPAIFDENTNSFLAPTLRIVLHEEQGSAVALIQAIATNSNRSFEDCEKQLKATTGAILLALNEKGESDIQHFGKLVKEDKNITFIPAETEELALPLYKSVKERKLIAPVKEEHLEDELSEDHLAAKQIVEDDDHAVLETIVADATTYVPEQENSDQEKSELENLEENKETNSTFASTAENSAKEQEFEPKGKSINWLWPILIILALVVAGVVFLFNPMQKESEPFLAEENTTETVLPDTIITALPPVEIDTVSAGETDSLMAQVSDPVITDNSIKEKISYEIIIVSFGKLAEAENYLETMRKKGYQLRILENRRAGNLFKVSYASFKDEETAQLELNKVRESLAKDAWLYKSKQ